MMVMLTMKDVYKRQHFDHHALPASGARPIDRHPVPARTAPPAPVSYTHLDVYKRQLKLFSGVIVDRTRRAKPWIVFGYGLAGLGRPLIAFVSSWPWLLAIRFADRVGKGLRSSPRNALLAASVPAERRGLAFGLHRAMDNAGAVIGPLVAALLLAAQVPLHDIFLWSVVPAVLCLALALGIREPVADAAAAPRPFDWRLRDMPPLFKRYLAVVALFTLGNSSNMFLLLRCLLYTSRCV